MEIDRVGKILRIELDNDDVYYLRCEINALRDLTICAANYGHNVPKAPLTDNIYDGLTRVFLSEGWLE